MSSDETDNKKEISEVVDLLYEGQVKRCKVTLKERKLIFTARHTFFTRMCACILTFPQAFGERPYLSANIYDIEILSTDEDTKRFEKIRQAKKEISEQKRMFTGNEEFSTTLRLNILELEKALRRVEMKRRNILYLRLYKGYDFHCKQIAVKFQDASVRTAFEIALVEAIENQIDP